MTIINHEYYVSLEIAKLLKEAGFDWEVYTYYTHIIIEDLNMDETTELMFGGKYNYNSSNDYSAPSLSITQRWLREVKGMELDICWHLTLDNQYKYAYAIKIKSIWKGLAKGKEIEVPSMDCLEAETCFNTFEEAQEAGIKKALEIILGKGE